VEGTIELLDLTPPNGASLVTTPPLRWISSDDERTRVLRQPSERRLLVAFRDRLYQPIDDAADFLRRLHPAECARKGA